MIVFDTNVVSELMRPTPSPSVLNWVRQQRPSEVCTTAVTVAEICYGIERLPHGQRKDLLLTAAEDFFRAFGESVLPFDTSAAGWYGRIVSHRDRLGRPINGFDAQIAAICRNRGASVATRNVKDFEETGIAVIDPWQDDAI